MNLYLQKEMLSVMNVYLDYNIIVELAKNKPMLEHILAAAHEKNYSFFYSPAHLEELAHADLEKSTLNLEDYFNTISTLTNNNDIRPLVLNKPIIFDNEKPIDVYDRVLNRCGGLKATKCAEENDTCQLARAKEIARVSQDNFSSVLSSMKTDEVFEYLCRNKFMCDYDGLVYTDYDDEYNDLKNRPYQELERAIEVLMKTLLHFGYHSDKLNHARSSTHDISHAHYATKCDMFVSNDKRLRSRVAATYHYLGVPTKVLSYDEFKEML